MRRKQLLISVVAIVAMGAGALLPAEAKPRDPRETRTTVEVGRDDD